MYKEFKDVEIITRKGTCGATLKIRIIEEKGALVTCSKRRGFDIMLPEKNLNVDKCITAVCSTCRLLKKGLVPKSETPYEEKVKNFIDF